MPTVLKPIPLIILLSIFSVSHAQTPDSIAPRNDSTAVPYYFENDFIFNYGHTYQIDTVLDSFQKYDPVNHPLNYYATLGNIGLAHKNLVFSPTPASGFDFGLHTFDQYLIRDETIKYYTTKKPYTELFYVMGKFREQFFDITHNQQIGKSLNIGVHANLVLAKGDYQQQKPENRCITFNTSYFTPKKRYGLIANYRFNHLVVQENGGIANDTVFEEKIETETQLIPVNLYGAENSWKETGLHLTHYYSFSAKDVMGNDSVKRSTLARIFSPGSILHTFSYDKLSLLFSDSNPDSLFFSVYYYNPNNTYDETKLKEYDNTLLWTNSRDPGCPLRVYASVKYEYTLITEKSNDSLLREDELNHLIFKAGVTLIPFKGWKLKADARWIKGDYIKDNQQLSAILETDLGLKTANPVALAFDITYYNQTPSWFLHHYNSNHFMWDNAFTKQNIMKAGIRLRSSLLKAGADYYHITDFIYFGTDTLPRQSDGSIDVANGFLSGKWTIHKVDLIGSLVYQYVSDKDVLRLPQFTGDVSVNFTQELFKHALRGQIGFDLYYTSAYSADAYMPATRVFHIQNVKELKQVFILDAILKLQVKKVRVFFMYNHLNSLFGKKDYYKTLHYPLQDGRFKLGIDWIFHD
jgi:hypothetical protein